MPGLVGIVGTGPAGLLREELRRMTACMYRRGSFASGTYVDESRHAYVGWTCHPGSYADGLPIRSFSGDVTVFFAGEHHGPVGSDEKAESLLPLYLEKGESFFPHLNGFFHGLIIDARNDEVILFDDRFGMQRLYYHEEPEAFYFASEAKSILAVRPELRAYDLKGLGEWLSCGAVLDHRSLFRGIDVLPGAARWTWRRGAPSPEADLLHAEVLGGPAEARAGGVLFASALDVRVETSRLSPSRGDDRIVRDGRIGYADDPGQPGGRIKRDPLLFVQWALSGESRRLDRPAGRPGRRAASHDGHHRGGFLPPIRPDRQRRRLEHGRQPGNERSAEHLRESDRPGVSPIRLTGNYGSEVLRRHVAFSPSNSIRRVLRKEWAESAENTAVTWQAISRDHPLSFVAFRQIPWYSFNRLQAEQSVLSMRSPFMDNAFLEIVYRAPEKCTQSRDISLRLIADGDRRLGEIMTDRGVTYPRKPSWIWTRAYYEFIFKMEYYASHGMPRFLASIDRRLGPFGLERNFLGRNKYYHLHKWFRDELAPYVRDILLSERALSRDHLERREVIKAVEAHLAGTENNTYAIDALLTVELTNRLLLDGGS